MGILAYFSYIRLPYLKTMDATPLAQRNPGFRWTVNTGKKALLIKDRGVPRKIVIDSYVLFFYSFTLVLDAWPSFKLVHNLYTYYNYYSSKYHTVIVGVMCTSPSFGGTMKMPTPTSI